MTYAESHIWKEVGCAQATSSQVCAPSCDPTAPVGHTKCHLCSRSSSTDIFGASALGPVLGVQRLLSQMWSRPQRAPLVVGGHREVNR